MFFVCVAFTSDIICLLFIPVQWLFFAASTYVWVQYVWHTGKSSCHMFTECANIKLTADWTVVNEHSGLVCCVKLLYSLRLDTQHPLVLSFSHTHTLLDLAAVSLVISDWLFRVMCVVDVCQLKHMISCLYRTRGLPPHCVALDTFCLY